MINSPGLTLFGFSANKALAPKLDRPNRNRKAREIIINKLFLVFIPDLLNFDLRSNWELGPKIEITSSLSYGLSETLFKFTSFLPNNSSWILNEDGRPNYQKICPLATQPC
jgi:hypothetical protein